MDVFNAQEIYCLHSSSASVSALAIAPQQKTEEIERSKITQINFIDHDAWIEQRFKLENGITISVGYKHFAEKFYQGEEIGLIFGINDTDPIGGKNLTAIRYHEGIEAGQMLLWRFWDIGQGHYQDW